MANKNQKKPLSKSLFNQYGGRMTLGQIDRIISQKAIHPWAKEYIKRVIERYHSPVSPHITEEEFKRGLEEMAKNTNDPVEKRHIEDLKKTFGLR